MSAPGARSRPAGGDAGFALALALVAIVLLEGFAALALLAAAARVRLAGDLRLATEADLRVASALAEVRVAQDAALAGLPDRARIDLPCPARDVRWTAACWAVRQGPLVQLSAEIALRNPLGVAVAARRATLLLGHVAADTVRVSGYRPRY